MHYQWTLYVLPMIAGAVLSTGLAVFTWQRSRISKSFTFLMLALAEWSGAYVLELLAARIGAKLFWAQVQYAGIVVVPVAWLIFALRYGDRIHPMKPRILVFLSIIPVITAGLAWTNDYHHLMVAEATLNTSGAFTVLEVTRGPWFWVHVTYAYTLILLGSILFVGKLLQFSRKYRAQVGILLIGALIPWVVNILYVLGANPVPHLDLTPFALTLSGLFIVWGIVRFRLLDIVPVAHNTVIEEMRDAVIVLDAHDRILEFNPAAERILPCAASLGEPITGALPDWPAIIERHRHPGAAQTDIRLGEGEAQRIYDLRIQPLVDREQRMQGRLMILYDVTERERAREAIRDRERFLALLHDITRAALETPDIPTMQQVFAERLGDLFGADGCYLTLWDEETGRTIPMADYDGKTDHPHTPPITSGVATVTASVLRTGRPLAIDDVHDTPHLDSSTRRTFPDRSLLGLPLIAGDRKLGAALIAFREPHTFTATEIARGKQVAGQVALAVAEADLITALQRYSHDLEARNEDLTAFAHTVAHDIKSPLGTLLGSADLLTERYADLSPEERHQLSQNISNIGHKINNIVDELLLLAEVRKGEVTLKPLDVAHVAQEACERVAPLIAQYQAEVVMPEAWTTALGHRPWVEEIWVNYLSNAIKYGGKPEQGIPPRVELGYRSAPAQGAVRFWVRDNGAGLTEEAQAYLFTPFTQLDQTRAEGYGLGLSIVRRIVEKLGGEVGIESQVGRGSTFTFTLPAVEDGMSEGEILTEIAAVRQRNQAEL
jgi:signal transduction histidine kinase/PAS domain-containing protein